MRILVVFSLLFLVVFQSHADSSSQYENMESRLTEELSRLSQEPGKSLLALDELKQTPGFSQYPDLMLRLLEAMCFSLMNLGQFAESAEAAEEGLAMLADSKVNKGRARLLVCKAGQHLEQGQLIQAYTAYTLALADSQADSELTAFVLQYRARFFLKYGSYQDAVNDLQAAFELYDKHTEFEGQANGVLVNLGMAYRKLRDYEAANTYYLKALVYFEQNDYPYIVARVLHSLGETAFLQKNYQQAIDYLMRSEKINVATKNENAMLDNYVSLGKAYMEKDNLGEAELYLNKGEAIAIRLNKPSALIDINILSAAIAVRKKQIHNLGELDSLLKLKNIEQSQLVSVLELLIKRSFLLDDFVAATGYLQRLLELERSIYNTSMQQQVTQAGLSFELKLAEKENLMLRISAESNEKLAQTNAEKLTLARALVIITTIALLVLTAMSLLLWLHNKKVREITLTDELTKIPNRRAIMAQLDEQVKLVQRYGNNAMLGIIDIDHFKAFNDNYGHQFGDEVLKEVATSCAELLRTTDKFGRLGGEEFLLLLPHSDESAGMLIAERLRAAVAELVLGDTGHIAKVTISIGMTKITSSDVIADCYDRADKALYQAKSTGRNKVVLSTTA